MATHAFVSVVPSISATSFTPTKRPAITTKHLTNHHTNHHTNHQRICLPNHRISFFPTSTNASKTARLFMNGNAQDLLIIGAGVLGRLIAAEWQSLHPHAKVIGETRTDAHHTELKQLGLEVGLAGTTSPAPPHIVFCAPPSGSQDYPATVAEAVARASPRTRLVFTSSGSVHGNASQISEGTPVSRDGRAARLAGAEDSVLAHDNGIVVRLSGLYTRDRGAHSYWLRVGEVTSAADGSLNLIHYADAAHAVVLALSAPKDTVETWDRRVFLAATKHRITRRQICQSALEHPLFKDSSMPVFPETAEHTTRERTYNNEWTRHTLAWAPRWESFEDFMLEDAKRVNTDVPGTALV